MHRLKSLALALSMLGIAQLATAKDLILRDPTGDDNGPGTYIYPTDAAYVKGSFDMTQVEFKEKGSDIEISVTFAKKIDDPWDSAKWQGNGFSVQMVQIYVDTDHKKGSGFTQALPGMNARFADDEAYEKVVIISPQPTSKLSQEVKQKAATLSSAVIIPRKVTVRGKTIIALVDAKQFGKPAPQWGVQALVASNEGYPAAEDLLSRKVNEFEGPHRFGGGCDYNGDPHFLDCLAAPAKGGADEIASQHAFLKKYKCGAKA